MKIKLSNRLNLLSSFPRSGKDIKYRISQNTNEHIDGESVDDDFTIVAPQCGLPIFLIIHKLVAPPGNGVTHGPP